MPGMNITTPTPEQIRQKREQIGLSQTKAAELIHESMRNWQNWEAGKAPMKLAFWELFLIKTSPQYTTMVL